MEEKTTNEEVPPTTADNTNEKQAAEDPDGVNYTELVGRNSTQDLVPRSKAESVQPQYYFGLRCWHPTWLQVLATAKFFTFLLCLDGLIEGALVSGFSSIVISTLERRFRFSSTAVSVLLVSFDMSVLISVIFISYFGDKRHKPRWVGYGIVMQGIGALVYAFPQFIFGSYEVGLAGNLTLQSCQLSGEVPYAECRSWNTLAYLILLLGNVLIGIGAAPLFTLGLSYIDDITLPKYVPIHMGIFYVAVAVGPALGYTLGGLFLSIYVDPWVDTRLEETDPGWVGAWWICFVLSGVLSLIIAVPFFLFPRFLPNHQEVIDARKKEHAIIYKSKFEDEDSLLVQLKAFPTHLLKLFKSISYLCVTFGLSFLFLTLYGLVAFGPKFIESVFNIPASTASLLAGAIAIPAGGIGTIVGSLIAFCLKSDTKKVSIVPWVCSLLALPALFGFFITCPTSVIAGINTPYANVSYLSLEDVTISSCNRDCMCTSTVFEPVCSPGGITYFSPCRAGCQKRYNASEPNVPLFENCTCITDEILNDNDSMTYSAALAKSTATDGKCPLRCNTLGLWLFLIGLIVFLIFTMRIPTLLITIRAVAEEQRSLALGVQSVLWRALGSIPGPILFGVIFDSSCVYWQEECNRLGNCWVYNNGYISIRAFFLAAFGVTANTIFMIFCWIFYPPVTCARTRDQKASNKSSISDDLAVENGGTKKNVTNPVFDPEEN